MTGGSMITRLWCCSDKRRRREAVWALKREADRQGLRLVGEPVVFAHSFTRGNHISVPIHFARQRFIRPATAPQSVEGRAP